MAEEQAGFRSGRSTLEQLFILHELCGQRKERKLPTFLAFLDIRRAYDRVWRTGLELRLWECGIRGHMWDFLCSMLGKQSVRRVAVNGGLSDRFSASIGLAQGAVLSPLLFLVFINGLRDALAAANLGVKFGDRRIPLLMYADDIVLIAKSPEQLQQMLDVVSDYALRWRLRFNTRPGKSNVVPVPASKRNMARCEAASLKLADGPLECSKAYKYLGVEFGTPGKRAWSAYLHRVSKAATARVNQVCYAAGRGRHPFSARSLCHLFDGYIRPSAEYAQALWGAMLSNEGKKLLAGIDRLFCRKVTRFHHLTPVPLAFLRAELGIMPSHLRAQQAALRFFGHLSSLPPSRLAGYVFQTRWTETEDNIRNHRPSYSWCSGMQELMQLSDMPADHALANAVRLACVNRAVPDNWKSIVDRLVKSQARAEHDESCNRLSSLFLFHQLHPRPSLAKWLEHSSLGHPGTRIRLQLRANDAHVMDRVGARCKPPLPTELRQCLFCDAGEVEDVPHFVGACPLVAALRLQCLTKLRSLVAESCCPAKRAILLGLDTPEGFVAAVLGGPVLDPLDSATRKDAEEIINTFFKHAWRKREALWQLVCTEGQRWRLRGL